MKKLLLCVAVMACAAGFAFAAPTAGHPNLIEAQKLLDLSLAKMDAAQAAHDWDLGGYAAQAKETINQAKGEINLAAKAANGRSTSAASDSTSTVPVDNIDPQRHPNLAAAQHDVVLAYGKLIDAQKANDFDMAGHAQKAKDLLEKANLQLKQAAETANSAANGHPDLNEAIKLLDMSLEKMDAAQAAHDWDLGGYAAKAKETINQAKDEITLAAKAANGQNTKQASNTSRTVIVENINSKQHPNLAAAQHDDVLAYNKLIDAQKANDFDMDGHAQKAKDLLEKANLLLKQAAETANSRK